MCENFLVVGPLQASRLAARFSGFLSNAIFRATFCRQI